MDEVSQLDVAEVHSQNPIFYPRIQSSNLVIFPMAYERDVYLTLVDLIPSVYTGDIVQSMNTSLALLTTYIRNNNNPDDTERIPIVNVDDKDRFTTSWANSTKAVLCTLLFLIMKLQGNLIEA